jgi:four helix bundle protein
MRFRYQDLRVTEEILKLIDFTYEATSNFPTDEKFGLTSQLRRAANSIYLNVAEGTARKSAKDFQRFLTIALGSTVEVQAASQLALRRRYITQQQSHVVEQLLESVWYKLCALRKSQTPN